MRPHTTRRHGRRTAALAVIAMVLAACGHRATTEELAAAYTTTVVVDGADGAAAPVGGGSGGATTGEVGVPDASTSTGGATVTPGNGGDAGQGAETPATGVEEAGGGAGSVGSGSGSGSGSGGDVGAPPPTGGETAGTPAVADKSPVVIGHIGTYSGIVGAIFNGGQQMAQAWAQDVNARGGLNGHPVQIITADDGGDPSKAQSLVRDMVENDGAIAFVGNLTVFTTQAYQEYVQENRIPVVGGTLYQLGWWEVPMLFPHGGYLDSVIVGLAETAVDRGNPKLGAIYCVEAFACARTGELMENGAAEDVGGELVYSTDVTIAQPNYTRECLSARDAGAQALIVAADVNAIGRLARDCASQGYEPLLLTASLAATDAARTDPNLQGMIVSTSVFPWTATDSQGAQQHLQVLQTYAPGVAPAGSTSQVWAAGKLLEAAAADLPDDPTSEDIIEGLYALPANFTTGGLTPPLNFNRDAAASRSECYGLLELIDQQFVAIQGSDFTCS